jgi:hypothetical protein
MNKKWSITDIPSQKGKVVIITGANSGLGFEITKTLAKKGAEVVMACRNQEKAEEAKEEILKESPEALLQIMILDLADIKSILTFAKGFKDQYHRLDILGNNAGVMFLPKSKTKDGFEIHFGVNHLGHFVLTTLLLDILIATEDSRVVTMSSIYHKQGKINFDDLQLDDDYNKQKAYAQSKLANLLFAFELQRKLQQLDVNTISVAAHPGYSATNLQLVGPEMEDAIFKKTIMKVGNFLFAQNAEKGALPFLYAAIAEDVEGGDYYGPNGLLELWGQPTKVEPSAKALDEQTAVTLWQKSEELINQTICDFSQKPLLTTTVN